MAIKYTKAPISEISFGVFLKTNALIRNAIIFEAIAELNKVYSVLQTSVPLQSEEMLSDNISVTQDLMTTGYSTYLLSTSDFLYKIEINQISFNFSWTRRDDMPSISSYPGFSVVYEHLKQIFKTIANIAADRGINLNSEIRLFSLKYADRLSLAAYKEEGMSLFDIVKFSYPKISIDGTSVLPDNIITKYSIKLPHLYGYSIANVNTPTYASPIGQILILDNTIKGYNADMDQWFEQAHFAQISFFENFFTKRVLDDWK